MLLATPSQAVFTAIARQLVEKLCSGKRVYIVYGEGFRSLAEYLHLDLGAEYGDSASGCKDACACILLDYRGDDACTIGEDTLVIAYLSVPKGLERRVVVVRARNIEDNIFLLTIGRRYLVTKLVGGLLCRARLPPYLLEAYNIVCEAYEEYGPLELKDAVTLVSARLGLRRTEARNLVAKLVAMKILRLRNRFISCG